MEYRVYNIEEKKWVDNKVYLTPDGELYTVNKTIFGKTKLIELSRDKYEYHRAIDLWDKDHNQVYEGDYIQAKVEEDRSVVGLVVFAQEMSAYIILCDDSNEFFTLGSEIMEFIQIVGNVFDGYSQLNKEEMVVW